MGAPEDIVDAYCMLSRGMVWNYTKKRMLIMRTEVYEDVITLDYYEGWIYNAWYPGGDEAYDGTESASPAAHILEMWRQN